MLLVLILMYTTLNYLEQEDTCILKSSSNSYKSAAQRFPYYRNDDYYKDWINFLVFRIYKEDYSKRSFLLDVLKSRQFDCHKLLQVVYEQDRITSKIFTYISLQSIISWLHCYTVT